MEEEKDLFTKKNIFQEGGDGWEELIRITLYRYHPHTNTGKSLNRGSGASQVDSQKQARQENALFKRRELRGGDQFYSNKQSRGLEGGYSFAVSYQCQKPLGPIGQYSVESYRVQIEGLVCKVAKKMVPGELHGRG